MSTINEAFEAWWTESPENMSKAALGSAECEMHRRTWLAATERAAKQNSETEAVFLWCLRNLTERGCHEMRADPSNGVMRAWEAIRARTGGEQT